MWTVAVHAEQVFLLAVPHSRAAAVHTRPPVAIFVPVALAAQLVALVEFDLFAARQPQLVAVVRVMTVEAPAVLGVMLEDEIVLRQLTPGGVEFGAFFMTIGAWKDAVGKRRRRDLNLALGGCRRGTRTCRRASRGRSETTGENGEQQPARHDATTSARAR